MNFEFSDEQRLLAESVRRLMADVCDFAARKTLAESETGFSRSIWTAFTELGLLALPFAEEEGGIGGGAVEIMIVMEEIGRVLALDPYLSHIVMSAALLRRGTNTKLRQSLVAGIIDGSLRLAPALGERAGGYHLSQIATLAQRRDDGFHIDGKKSLVMHGGNADRFIVSARLQNDGESGIGLFVMPADAPGLHVRAYRTQDSHNAAELTFSNVRVPADALLVANADAAIEAAGDEATAALCAEAVGAMERLIAMTVDYLKTRKQFGQAIGNFQALQHRAADMVVELEQAKSMALYATMMSRHEDQSERARAMSFAKVQINRAARMISQTCVQLHGGIGMTMEHAAGHYMKRLAMIEKTLGDTDFHMDRLAGDYRPSLAATAQV